MRRLQQVARKRRFAGHSIVARLLVLVSLACAQPAYALTPIRILLVGDSLTTGVAGPLGHILDSQGYQPTIQVIAPATASLVDNHDAAEAAIAAGPGGSGAPSDFFDWVVLQDSSWQCLPNVNEGVFSSLTTLADLSLSTKGRGGRTIVYMLYPYKVAFEDYSPPDYCHYTNVLARLERGGCGTQTCPPCCAGYIPVAHKTDVNTRVAPVGQVFVDFYEKLSRPLTEIFKADGLHLKDKGSYLVALSIFAALQRSLPDSVWNPGNLTAPSEYKMVVRDAVFGLASSPPPTPPIDWNLWKEATHYIVTGTYDATNTTNTVNNWTTGGGLSWLTANSVAGLHFVDVKITPGAEILDALIQAVVASKPLIPGSYVGRSYVLLANQPANQSPPPFTAANWNWQTQWPPSFGTDTVTLAYGSMVYDAYGSLARPVYGLTQAVHDLSWSGSASGDDLTVIVASETGFGFQSQDTRPSAPPKLFVRWSDN